LFLRFAFGLAANTCIACRENTCRRRLPITRNVVDIRAKLYLKLYRIRWYHIRELLSFSISFHNRKVSLHRDSGHNCSEAVNMEQNFALLA
jgi:hypothetical protein